MIEIQTKRLTLRHLHPSDAAAIHELIYSDAEVWRYYSGVGKTLEETARWVSWRGEQSREGQFGLLAVEDSATRCVLGLCGLQPYAATWLVLESEAEQRGSPLEVEITYALGRRYWGQGCAFEACEAIIGYAFTELRLRRLVTSCHPENARARRLQERLGMQREHNLHPEHGDPSFATEGILNNPLAIKPWR